MNLPLFIARRMMQRPHDARPGVMERIAVVSVALSVAVMILTVGVMLGFKREVAEKMTAFAAHVTLTDIRGLDALTSSSVTRGEVLEDFIRSEEGFRRLSPYALKAGIVRTDDAVEGVVLKGVDSLYDWSSFGEWLVEGELPRVGTEPRSKDVLISKILASRLDLGVGDRMEMLFVDDGERPRRDRFRISGIFSSGMEEMDRMTVMTDMRNVQRLSGWGDDLISGYDIFVGDVEDAPAFASRLDRRLLYDDDNGFANLVAMSVQERYPNIFDWLLTLDVNAAVVIVIMIVVAFFNISAALMTLVLERTRMIGLMKTLGMTDSSLRRVFLYRAAFIALRGVVWGNIAGVGLALVQRWGHVLKLSSEGYMLSEVPIALDAAWWLAINAGFVVAIVLLLIIPTSIISTVKPAETLRYE